MKILVVCHDHPDYAAGGTEIMSHDLCAAYNARDGIKARYLAASTALSRPEARPGALERLGADYLLRTGRYDMFTMTRLDGADWVAAITRVIAETDPDIVHLHGLDRLGVDLVTVLRRLRPRMPIVLTLHDYQLICPNAGLLLTRPDGALCHRPGPDACRRCFPQLAVGRHAMRKAHIMAVLGMVDAFVAPSQNLKDRFVAWGLQDARIKVLPNGVPPGAPTRTRILDGLDRQRNRFAFFGQFASHKGLYTLLEAAARLKAGGADLRLSLYGRMFHPSKDAQDRFAAALDRAAPLAQHLGAYDRSELPGLMAATDWVVLPSLWFENAPLTVLEAQRAGRPVICTDIGGLPELVHDGVNGLHVPRGDAAALAETMALAAENPDLWDRMAEGIVPPPATQDVAEQHLALFRSLYQEAAA